MSRQTEILPLQSKCLLLILLAQDGLEGREHDGWTRRVIYRALDVAKDRGRAILLILSYLKFDVVPLNVCKLCMVVELTFHPAI